MTGTIFQLYDSDVEEFGLVYTPHSIFTKEEIQKLWRRYYNDDWEEDLSCDNFVEYLNIKFPNGDFSRIYVEDVNL